MDGELGSGCLQSLPFTTRTVSTVLYSQRSDGFPETAWCQPKVLLHGFSELLPLLLFSLSYTRIPSSKPVLTSSNCLQGTPGLGTQG